MRRIGFLPPCTSFKPRGVPMNDLVSVSISHVELEAVRLVDLLGMEHEDTAQRMGISRKTMASDLKNGRRKIADVILNGKALRIEGGNFEYRRDLGIEVDSVHGQKSMPGSGMSGNERNELYHDEDGKNHESDRRGEDDVE